MRVLFDQGTPVPLRRRLPDHRVETAYERGWSDLRNSALLDRAEAEGFDVLVTTDQSLRHQQNLAARRLSGAGPDVHVLAADRGARRAVRGRDRADRAGRVHRGRDLNVEPGGPGGRNTCGPEGMRVAVRTRCGRRIPS